MSQLDAKDGVAIAQIVVYTPALAVAVLLASRHGFKRSAGWLYLVLFGIIRILGAALELATISDRENTSLIGGAATLQTIGLSPLILVMLALSSRVLTSVNASRTTFLKPRMLQGVKLIVLVGLILGIVGGTKLSLRIYDAAVAAAKGANGGKIVYTIPEESQAGLGLMMAGYVLLVLIILLLATDVAAAAAGEKRILGAIAAALPFVLVRLIYSASPSSTPPTPTSASTTPVPTSSPATSVWPSSWR